MESYLYLYFESGGSVYVVTRWCYAIECIPCRPFRRQPLGEEKHVVGCLLMTRDRGLIPDLYPAVKYRIWVR